MSLSMGRAVCVIGAGGFLASWLVKILLEKGYIVRGTLRNPDDPKNSHLWEMEGAKERLSLRRADVLVFHTACPLTNDPEVMMEPAIKGTENVIKAAAETEVQRVVFTSSIGAVTMDSKRSPDAVVNESYWSDLKFCKDTKNWYCYGKAVAEMSATYMAKEKGVDLVVIIPTVIIGPLLQPTLNASTIHILKYINGSVKTYANLVQGYVDVRDTALAHILVYETPSASGRYICSESVLHRGDVINIVAKLFPEYSVPTKCKDDNQPRLKPYKVSNQKLKDLGLEFTPVTQSLYETVKSLQEKKMIFQAKL